MHLGYANPKGYYIQAKTNMSQSSKSFKIHFVCRGNTYRSRLAAAYMATLLDDRFAISSSGIEADRSKQVTTSASYTKATAKVHKLTHQIDTHKTQTTTKLLDAADVIVFMNKDVYDDALREYELDVRKCLVWDVADIGPEAYKKTIAKHTQQVLVDAAAGTFAAIRVHCDALYHYLTHTAWVDVVDAKNHAAGLRLPMEWATDRGLWHRGVHVVVQTSDGKFIVGKRSNNIVFAPGMLEITLGGGIDTGETPLQAAQRETHEELGVHVPEKHFKPLFLYKVSSFHPHYNKRTRGHVYVYVVKLPVHSGRLKPQPSEVAELRLLTKGQVRRLLRTYRIAHFGRLTWRHKFYKKAIAYSAHA